MLSDCSGETEESFAMKKLEARTDGKTWQLENPKDMNNDNTQGLASLIRKKFRISKEDFKPSANLAKSMLANSGGDNPSTRYVQKGQRVKKGTPVVNLEYFVEGNNEGAGGGSFRSATIIVEEGNFHCSCCGVPPSKVSAAKSCRNWCAHKLFYVVDKNIDVTGLLKYAPEESKAEAKERNTRAKRLENVRDERHSTQKPNLRDTAIQQARRIITTMAVIDHIIRLDINPW